MTILIVVSVLINRIGAETKYLNYSMLNNGDYEHGIHCHLRYPTILCYLPRPSNPYRRGCEISTRCKRSDSISLFKKILELFFKKVM